MHAWAILALLVPFTLAFEDKICMTCTNTVVICSVSVAQIGGMEELASWEVVERLLDAKVRPSQPLLMCWRTDS